MNSFNKVCLKSCKHFSVFLLSQNIIIKCLSIFPQNALLGLINHEVCPYILAYFASEPFHKAVAPFGVLSMCSWLNFLIHHSFPRSCWWSWKRQPSCWHACRQQSIPSSILWLPDSFALSSARSSPPSQGVPLHPGPETDLTEGVILLK